MKQDIGAEGRTWTVKPSVLILRRSYASVQQNEVDKSDPDRPTQLTRSKPELCWCILVSFNFDVVLVLTNLFSCSFSILVGICVSDGSSYVWHRTRLSRLMYVSVSFAARWPSIRDKKTSMIPIMLWSESISNLHMARLVSRVYIW